jgi:hypothetical protein
VSRLETACYIETRGKDHALYEPCTHVDVYRVAIREDYGRALRTVAGEFATPREAIDLANAIEAGQAVPMDAEGDPLDLQRRCLVCQRPLPASVRADRHTCSNACRVALSRQRAATFDYPSGPVDGSTLDVTLSAAPGEALE